MVDYFPH